MVNWRLPDYELERRARNVRILLTDCDGVLTDGTVVYSAYGEETRSFSVIDGMGVELLRSAGIMVGMVSGENAGSIAKRADKLRLEPVLLGIRDKKGSVVEFLFRHGFSREEVAYIGDDVNDLPLMQYLSETSITGCPADAHRSLEGHVNYRTSAGGGKGAFREFAEWVLLLRGIRIDSFPINVSKETPNHMMKEDQPA
jgi:3-deoxy-D-manno-octulosonate 8-phosphate phosphatase (KDO 8-P phosphatase)